MLAGMTRLLPVVSAVFLLSLGAHAQAPAVRPPARPVTPPALTPGYNPNTPPDPVHTPPGTGLPEVGQPGTHAVPVKRSPNTRALPDEFDPKKEPGVWAADGATRATIEPYRRLHDVDYPMPQGDGANRLQPAVSMCLRGLAEAARSTAEDVDIAAFPVAVRKCLAARAFLVCAQNGFDTIESLRTQARPYEPAQLERWRRVVEHARKTEAEYCAGVTVTPAQDARNREVIAEWYRTLTKGLQKH